MNTTKADKAEEALYALGQQYASKRQDSEQAREALRKAVLQHLAAGEAELRVAHIAGIDRTTVRKWRAQQAEILHLTGRG